jgi:hypothetical protein
MFFATYILCAIHLNTLAQKNWEEIVSVEQVCENYPEVVKRMLNQFDLDRQGLEKVKAANESGNTVEASKYLLDYYKKNHNAQDLRKVTPPPLAVGSASRSAWGTCSRCTCRAALAPVGPTTTCWSSMAIGTRSI